MYKIVVKSISKIVTVLEVCFTLHYNVNYNWIYFCRYKLEI